MVVVVVPHPIVAYLHASHVDGLDGSIARYHLEADSPVIRKEGISVNLGDIV